MFLRKSFDLCSMTLLGAALAAGCATETNPRDQALGTTMAPLLGADASKIIPDQYIVMFEGDVGAEGMASAMARISLASPHSRIEHVYDVIPAFAARLSPEDLGAIRRDPAVAWVEHDQVVHIEPAIREQADGQLASPPASQPDGSLTGESDYGIQTIYPLPGGQPDGIDRVDQPSLPRDGQYDDHGCSGADVLAYVIDTGIRATHTEFSGRVNTSRGFTAIADGNGTQDCVGQGTYLASIIGGKQLGMARNATLIPVRVLNCTGSGTMSGVINGVNHVANNCSDTEKCVATMAFGGSFSSSLDSAVTNLVNSGVPVTVPIGSTGCSGSPASALATTGVLGVNDVDCPTSTITGACVDIYGPATTILGAGSRNDTATQTLSSTGAAAAHVAGALAQGMSCGYTGTRTTNAECASPPGIKPLVYNDYGAESCAGRCGPIDPLKPCNCDSQCESFGDCCADYSLACP
jgi:subtilisin family serine protease